jgi:GDP-mannose 6-dehydrogenase
LARDGNEVVGVDVDAVKLELIRAGKTPVVEDGMLQLMSDVMQSGRARVTQDLRESLNATELSLICVGTPSSPNGSQDQRAIVRVARELGQALAEKPSTHTFVFRSTVVPGTVEDALLPLLESESGKREGRDFHVCFQPEFLREGSSIRDYDHPPFTLVGARSQAPVKQLRQLFGHLPCEFYPTSIRAAEMVKYCCNNFHALKITFANESARLCEALKVDPFEVMDLVCRDTQLNISRAYLNPGFAFGGSCLPKELRATMYLAKTHDIELPMLSAVLPSTRAHIDHAAAKILALGRRRIGFLGLSFKAGTDDLRESPLVTLAEQLIGKGLSLLVYDPDVHVSRLVGANRRYIDQHLPHIGCLMRSDLEEVIEGSEVIVAVLGSGGVCETLVEVARPDQGVVDLGGLKNPPQLRAQYIGLCW